MSWLCKSSLILKMISLVHGHNIHDLVKFPMLDHSHLFQFQHIKDMTDSRDLKHHLQHLKGLEDRKSTRLNSSHVANSYAVFCLKKKKHNNTVHTRDHMQSTH